MVLSILALEVFPIDFQFNNSAISANQFSFIYFFLDYSKIIQFFLVFFVYILQFGIFILNVLKNVSLTYRVRVSFHWQDNLTSSH